MGVLKLLSRPGTFALACWLAIAPSGAAAQRTASAEDDIKAAFLFNFTKFVEWPAMTRPGPFRVCTVSEPAFDATVERTLAGETAAGRPIARVTPQTPADARDCQMLFVGRRERADRWISAVRGAPVLVVGETRSAWDGGVAIAFVVEDNRVKFDINEEAAANGGLTISSKLLRVARNVRGRRGQ